MRRPKPPNRILALGATRFAHQSQRAQVPKFSTACKWQEASAASGRLEARAAAAVGGEGRKVRCERTFSRQLLLHSTLVRLCLTGRPAAARCVAPDSRKAVVAEGARAGAGGGRLATRHQLSQLRGEKVRRRHEKVRWRRVSGVCWFAHLFFASERDATLWPSNGHRPLRARFAPASPGAILVEQTPP